MSHDRLVALFEEANGLAGAEREEFVRKVCEEDEGLGRALERLLGHEAVSLADRIKDKYGSEADPHISLEGESESSDFTSEVVQRLAGRGENFGRYTLKGEVARGGQGAVLRVWDEDLRRNLAMKVVLGKGEERGDTPNVDSRSLGRFLEEAQVTGQLDHPGIVPVHELGLDPEGRVYFTMKLVKGRDLKAIFDLVKDGKEGWTQTRALTVLLKVCEAMAYAHSKGVVHRDLKPSNIMVGKFGEVYVMDWGLARVVGREDKKDIRVRPQATTTEMTSERHQKAGETPDSPLVTMDGDVVGTPAYMSPEQAAGDLDSVGPQSDVYAVGAMLYELLAGHMPYVKPGMQLNAYAIWYKVQEGLPDSVEKRAPGAPAELVAICERAMKRDGMARYQDTSDLAAELHTYLEGGIVGAHNPTRWGRICRLWKRSSVFTRVGLLLTYAWPTLVIGLAWVVYAATEVEDFSEGTLGFFVGLSVIMGPLLLFGSLFVPKKPRILAVLGLLPAIAFFVIALAVNTKSIYGGRGNPRAREHFESQQYDKAIAILESLADRERTPEDYLLWVDALRLLGRNRDALTVAETVQSELFWRVSWSSREEEHLEDLNALLLLELGDQEGALTFLRSQFE